MHLRMSSAIILLQSFGNPRYWDNVVASIYNRWSERRFPRDDLLGVRCINLMLVLRDIFGARAAAIAGTATGY